MRLLKYPRKKKPSKSVKKTLGKHTKGEPWDGNIPTERR